jgi:GNAT superfamily N-acetyltransferase
VRLSEIPEQSRPELSYQALPALLLGRMGVDERYRGSGYRTVLIREAFRASIAVQEFVGHVGIVVDAKDDDLVGYYEKHGFERLERKGRRLFIPVPRITKILQESGINLYMLSQVAQKAPVGGESTAE